MRTCEVILLEHQTILDPSSASATERETGKVCAKPEAGAIKRSDMAPCENPEAVVVMCEEHLLLAESARIMPDVK